MESISQQVGQVVEGKPKKFCRLCRQHGIFSGRSKHTCLFENCSCKKCTVIQLQRKIMSKQIKLRRIDERLYNDTIPSQMGLSSSKYVCQRCKNHGERVLKKNHKFCPHQSCQCEKCTITQARALLEGEIKRSCLTNVAKKMETVDRSRLNTKMFDMLQEILAKNDESNGNLSQNNEMSSWSSSPTLPNIPMLTPQTTYGSTFQFVSAQSNQTANQFCVSLPENAVFPSTTLDSIIPNNNYQNNSPIPTFQQNSFYSPVNPIIPQQNIDSSFQKQISNKNLSLENYYHQSLLGNQTNDFMNFSSNQFSSLNYIPFMQSPNKVEFEESNLIPFLMTYIVPSSS